MSVQNLVKRIQDVMRTDSGINGDAQRIEQMVWMFFLKVYDAQEETWEFTKDNFTSIIPEQYRWRNWATDHKDGKALTGDPLLDFVNNGLFPTLKNLEVDEDTPRSQTIVKEVFEDINQYMKVGVQLRKVINIIDEIDFTDTEDRHMFGDIYEGILKGLQSAGNAGEFYTARALTDIIIRLLDPKLGETFGDWAGGTLGFVVSFLNYIRPSVKTVEDEEVYQNSARAQEWKPLPYLLGITNLLVHGIESPNVLHCDSLAEKVTEYKEEDKVDIEAMNPPYGGATAAADKLNFPAEMRSSESADMFVVLMMYRLKAHGRAAVILPDGFLFGTDGAKLAIKTKLLREFNLHTVVRLPGSIFAPYTSIATNILFFNNEHAEGAPEGYNTKETWFYRLDMPEGYKHFSKTKPMKVEHCQPLVDWWHDRHEITTEDGDEKSRCFSVEQLVDLGCNLDQCKFPKEEEEVLPPKDLLKKYHEEREKLDKTIDSTLAEIENMLGIDINEEKA